MHITQGVTILNLKQCVNLSFSLLLSVACTSCYSDSGERVEKQPKEEISNEVNTSVKTDDKDLKPAECDESQEPESLPSMVLVGTDLQDVADFTLSSVAMYPSKSDVGGAEISLKITQDNNGVYSAARTYSEPGMPSDVRKVNDLCLNGPMLYNTSVIARFTTEGILWLELDGENSMMSTELWILLTKE